MICDYFTNASNFFIDSYKFLRLIRYISKYNLRNLDNEELKKLKEIVIDNGALSIKFMQWYLSKKELENYDNSYDKIINSFEDVFDNCPYHSIEETKKTFKNDFNIDLEDSIDINSIENIGSGSIGQVYKCKLDDKIVAMKVKHPNVDKIISNQKFIIDMVIYIQKIRCLKNYFGLHYDINDFMDTLYTQLDFKNEVYNSYKFTNIFIDNPLIVIPRVLYHSNNIIISEYEQGEDYLDLTKYQKVKAGLNFYCLILEMVIFQNFIHGDLHKKNWKVRISDDGEYKIIVYDFGLCFSTEDKKFNNTIWDSFEENDVEKLISSFRSFICSNNKDYDIETDREFIEESMREVWSQAFSTNILLGKLTEILRSKDLYMNKTFTNMVILLILIQKIFVESDFLRIEKDSKFDESRNSVHKFNDVLAFTRKYEFYNHISEYIEEKIKCFKGPVYMESEKYLELDDPLNF